MPLIKETDHIHLCRHIMYYKDFYDTFVLLYMCVCSPVSMNVCMYTFLDSYGYMVHFKCLSLQLMDALKW